MLLPGVFAWGEPILALDPVHGHSGRRIGIPRHHLARWVNSQGSCPRVSGQGAADVWLHCPGTSTAHYSGEEVIRVKDALFSLRVT